MKQNAMTLLIVLVVGGLLFFGTLFGLTFFVIVDKIPLPQIAPPVAEKPSEEEEKKMVHHKKIFPTTLEGFTEIADQLDGWRLDLNKKELEITKIEQEMEKKKVLMATEQDAIKREKEKIEQMQRTLEEHLLKIEKEQSANFKDLGQLFAKMTPEETINFLRLFEDNQTSKLLTYIPKKQLIKILEIWSKNYPNDRKRLVNITSEMRNVVKMQDETVGAK
jgi:flagellar motility protein MotE (MotC chaperone)